MIQYEHIKPTFVVVSFRLWDCRRYCRSLRCTDLYHCCFFLLFIYVFIHKHLCVFFLLFLLYFEIFSYSFFLCCVICLFAIKYHFDIIILIHNVYIYITSIKSIQTNQHFLQYFYVYHFPYIFYYHFISSV